MSERLLTLDAAHGSVLVACQCGFRTMRGSREAARAAADQHRAELHPRQATYVRSKRRARDRRDSDLVGAGPGPA